MKFPQQRFHDDILHYVADSLVLWTQHNVSPNEAATEIVRYTDRRWRVEALSFLCHFAVFIGV